MKSVDWNFTMAVPKKILRLSQNFEELKQQVQLLESTVRRMSEKNGLLVKENAVQSRMILQLVNFQKSKPLVQHQVCDWNHLHCLKTHSKFNYVGPQSQVVKEKNKKNVKIQPQAGIFKKNEELSTPLIPKNEHTVPNPCVGVDKQPFQAVPFRSNGSNVKVDHADKGCPKKNALFFKNTLAFLKCFSTH